MPLLQDLIQNGIKYKNKGNLTMAKKKVKDNVKKILVLNGPNLNLLGVREVNVYGTSTLKDIEESSIELGKNFGVDIVFSQSNHEGALIDHLQVAKDSGYSAVVLNAGAYTHTSIALRDVIAAINVPVIEIHLSNIHSREEFRKESMIAPVCKGQISGFGVASYELGIRAALTFLGSK